MNVFKRVSAGILNRRFAPRLLWVMVIVVAAIAVNGIGISIVGSVDSWSQWLDQHRSHFFAWRLCLYGATTYGWWWMRKRIRQREPSAEARSRLLRTEICAAIAIVVLESSMMLRSA